MFVILTEQDTLLSECVCVENKINHTLIKKMFTIKYSNMCGGLAKQMTWSKTVMFFCSKIGKQHHFFVQKLESNTIFHSNTLITLKLHHSIAHFLSPNVLIDFLLNHICNPAN